MPGGLVTDEIETRTGVTEYTSLLFTAGIRKDSRYYKVCETFFYIFLLSWTMKTASDCSYSP